MSEKHFSPKVKPVAGLVAAFFLLQPNAWNLPSEVSNTEVHCNGKTTAYGGYQPSITVIRSYVEGGSIQIPAFYLNPGDQPIATTGDIRGLRTAGGQGTKLFIGANTAVHLNVFSGTCTNLHFNSENDSKPSPEHSN